MPARRSGRRGRAPFCKMGRKAQQRGVQLAEPAVNQRAGSGGGAKRGEHAHENGAHIEHGDVAGKRVNDIADGDADSAQKHDLAEAQLFHDLSVEQQKDGGKNRVKCGNQRVCGAGNVRIFLQNAGGVETEGTKYNRVKEIHQHGCDKYHPCIVKRSLARVFHTNPPPLIARLRNCAGRPLNRHAVDFAQTL